MNPSELIYLQDQLLSLLKSQVCDFLEKMQQCAVPPRGWFYADTISHLAFYLPPSVLKINLKKNENLNLTLPFFDIFTPYLVFSVSFKQSVF